MEDKGHRRHKALVLAIPRTLNTLNKVILHRMEMEDIAMGEEAEVEEGCVDEAKESFEGFLAKRSCLSLVFPAPRAS